MKAWFRDLVMYSFSAFLSILALLIPKSKKLVLLGAFAGKRFADNSALVFEKIKEEHHDLQAVWLTNNRQIVQAITKNGGEAYLRRSVRGIWLSLRTSIYLTSHGIKDVLMYVPMFKRPKHIYLHHGIPLRKGWFDLKNAPKKSIRSSKQKINCTHFMIAPSTFAASQQNQLLPIGLEKFAYTGLPRNDIFFDETFDPNGFKDSLGINQEHKLILYCPTWRPWAATRFFPFKDLELEKLNSWLTKNNTLILLRPHHVDLNSSSNAVFWKKVEQLDSMKLLSHDICPNVNHLARISDALITDYSSMYYDYLLLEKPVVFLPYDVERYESEIGFYPNYHEITYGDKPKNQTEFLQTLQDITEGKDNHSAKRNALKDKFYDVLDGQSTERVVELVKSLLV